MPELERTDRAKDVADRAGLALEPDCELATLAKALGHPLRVRIVRLLAKQRSCVCGELVGELPVAQSTVSQHLKLLKQAGVIQGTIDGPRICYCLVPGVLQRLRDLVDSLTAVSEEPELDSTEARKCG